MRVGVHVSIAGGLLQAVERAARLGCETMQIFSRSPRGGKAAPIPGALAGAFDRARRAAGIEPLAVHTPYVLNLASPQPAMWAYSAALYAEEYARAAALNAGFLVTHVGSLRGDGEAAGVGRVAEAISRALRCADGPTMVLLENTAGSGQGLGYRFEQLAAIRQAVAEPARVGICLDTAHLFAAGFAIHTADGVEETIAAFDRIVGLEHLRLLHVNDSKAPFASRVDRHWHIGQGAIGLEGFRRLLRHPALAQVPCVLETPKQTEADDRRNLATVRRLLRTGFIHPRGRAGPSCQPRQARGARRTRRRVRERRATPRGAADRPSPWSTRGLRRHRASCGVAPPRSTPGSTPSSSLLAAGPVAFATRLARMYETGSRDGTRDVRLRALVPA